MCLMVGALAAGEQQESQPLPQQPIQLPVRQKSGPAPIVIPPSQSKTQPITAAVQELPPQTQRYKTYETQTIQQTVPYTVQQRVIQPVLQRVIRQRVPVIQQQIQKVYTPVVQQVNVPQYQTVVEEGPAAQPIIRAPIQQKKSGGAAATLLSSQGQMGQQGQGLGAGGNGGQGQAPTSGGQGQGEQAPNGGQQGGQ